MCGIVGIVHRNASGYIREATNIISHRGPDDFGYFSFENLALGHRRLSILDLSPRGHQPMQSQDGRFTIVFNGEIYNHMELRHRLLSEFNFKSTSDTETILYGYIKYGRQLFSKLNGIFAFSIFDKDTKDVVVVRDQFGVKPLYYVSNNDSLFFASELKALISIDFDKEIDVEALSRYIYFLYSPGEQTPYKHVRKLKPGHFIAFNISAPSKVKVEKYYEIPFKGNYFKKTEVELIDDLISNLRRSVESQLLSDVPVGFFLSGGLDSASLVALARELHPEKNLNCYTIDTGGSFDNFSDDLYYAKICAKYLNVNLEIVKADVQIVEHFDKMIWHLDEPQADAAPLNVLSIAQKAREKGDIVLIGGTAGDDLFSGYRRHQALNFEPYFDFFPDFVWKGADAFLSMLSPKGSFIRRFRKLAAQSGVSKLDRMAGYFGWLDFPQVVQLFREAYRPSLQNAHPNNLLIRSLDSIPMESNNLNQMLFWEMKYFLPDHNLNYTDKMSMAEGIEVRVPFLDLDLVEFSTKLPPDLKMKGETTKYLLKKAMERYLPKEVIYRPKTGFGAPVRQWITKDLDPMISERLSKDNLQKWNIFDPDAIHKLISDNKNGYIDASYSIWALLAIHSWLEQFSK